MDDGNRPAAPGRRTIALVVAAGAAVGLAYALSPLTVWAVAALAGLFAWAGRGLERRERRWVWSLLTAALAVRLALVVGLFVASNHQQSASFFWDGDGVYLKQRAEWIRNVWLGVPVGTDELRRAFDRSYGWTTYLYVLAWVQYWLGPAPYALHLLSITCYLAAAVLLFRLGRSAYGRTAAMLALAIALFTPTLVSWSVSILKEPPFTFLAALGLVAAVTVVRGRGLLLRAVAVGVIGLELLWAGDLREGGSALLASGLAAGALGGLAARLPRTLLVALLILGGAGGGLLAARTPPARARWNAFLERSARRQIGNERENGHGYKVLDQRFYPAGNEWRQLIASMTMAERLRFLVRSLWAFVVLPRPWDAESRTELAFIPQQMIWYPLVALAGIGFAAGLRCDPLVTWLLTGFILAGWFGIALNSGNIGTMVRHRDIITPFLASFSALGAVVTVSASVSGRTGHGGD